jgi:hypothetical protein
MHSYGDALPSDRQKNYCLYIAGYTQPIKGRKMNQLPSSIRSFHGISSVWRTLLEDDVPTRAPYYCSNLIPSNTLTLRGRSLRFPTPLGLFGNYWIEGAMEGIVVEEISL